MVRHTEQDLAELQALIDRSVDSAGRFMSETFELPDHGLTARQLTSYFEDRMRPVAIATVTAKGEPRVSPVGAVFHRTTPTEEVREHHSPNEREGRWVDRSSARLDHRDG